MKTLYTLSICAFVAALLFLGGMYVGTKIVTRLNDTELTELADDYESKLGRLHEEFGKQRKLLERANQYLEDSIVERDAEIKHDRERIEHLTESTKRIQAAARESLEEAGNIAKTIQRIEQAADGIGEDIQGLRNELQRIQESERDSDWFIKTGEYDPEDWWRRFISRYNRDHLGFGF